ncbi:MAG TPA: translation initiation factor IF-2 [Thermoplasmata archaeon]|nr:translation initiation factor IF-2 [Thermoplasmata archaeon]
MAHIRQPIVSVLGHVDHGKTSLLDAIRGTSVASREAGGITQHIGATEVPIEAIRRVCGDLVAGKSFKVPGLLFIDTPGHPAFTTLRARGGSLADLAVLVVDINEGFRPQTIESIKILKQHRTPFVVAANKIDLLPGWRKHPGAPFGASSRDQPEGALAALDEKLYALAAKFYDQSFSAERYDRVSDFTANLAIVPTSAKHGVGVPDLLLMLIGLAQRFLEEQLSTEEGPGEGTILEVKEEKGHGTTLDAIIYKGTIRRGDAIVLGSTGPPIVTKVRALLKPKPLDEIRDPQDRFGSVKSVTAAAGVKVVAPNVETAVAGGPIRVVVGDPKPVVDEIAKETSVQVETSEGGLIVKADALGSLEALAFECKTLNIPIRIARIGPVSRRDVVDAATIPDPLHRVILAFNVGFLPDADEELLKRPEVKVLANDVIYRLLEDYGTWVEEKKKELEKASRQQLVYPGKVLLLPDHVFRVSKPAIVGVRVLAGRVRPGQALMRGDGKEIGRIKSIRSGEQTLEEARTGQEVAIAIDGVTVGRQIDPGDVLYNVIPELDARTLGMQGLAGDEREALDAILAIRRKEDRFWGM